MLYVQRVQLAAWLERTGQGFSPKETAYKQNQLRALADYQPTKQMGLCGEQQLSLLTTELKCLDNNKLCDLAMPETLPGTHCVSGCFEQPETHMFISLRTTYMYMYLIYSWQQ